MLRKMILMEESGKRRLTLPVTPESFAVSSGIAIQTVHIHEVGDVNLAGQKTLDTIKLSCLFPATKRPYANSDSLPYDYIEQLTDWLESKKLLRYIVTGTPVNKTVLLESVEYGEQDGTNDVYATVTLREYVELEATETVRPKGTNKPRAQGNSYTSSDVERTHIVVKNDCMSSIALKYYGNGGKAYYEALAAYNNRSAYAYIYVGEIIKCPSKEVLGVK